MAGADRLVNRVMLAILSPTLLPSQIAIRIVVCRLPARFFFFVLLSRCFVELTHHIHQPCIFSQGCGWCPELSRCEGTDMVKLQPCKQFAIYCPRPASFDAGSFFGGAALVVGLGAAAVISFFVIKRFRRSNYSQL